MIDRDLAARARFLAALEGGATVTAAAKSAGLSRQTVYAWRSRGGDPELAAALEAARLRGGRGRRRGAPGGPPVPVAASAPTAGAPEPGARRERALAVLDQLASDPTVAARDRISAAAKLVSSLPAVAVTPAPAVAAPETPGDGGRLLVLDRAREFLAKARAT